MTSNNVTTSSSIIKSPKEDIQPYQLGNFGSHGNHLHNDSMKNVGTYTPPNGTEDQGEGLLQEMQKLQQMILAVEQKVSHIESHGIAGRDLDKQIVEALKDLKQYAAFFEQATFQMETKLLKTSLSIAKKIIGIEVGENSTTIAKETIHNMMDKVKSASKISIHLNPKDYIILKDQLKFEAHVILQEDPNVTPGGVVIASDLGNFDGSIESKIQSMLESLEAIV